MTIKSELLELTIQHGGILRAEEVVSWAAENKDSAIHQAIEWRDDVAAQSYRIAQVRQLIAVHVVNEQGVRQLVSLTIDRGEGGYRTLDAVMQNSNMRQVLLSDALADLERLRAKYGTLQELARVFEEAEAIAAKKSAPARKRSRRS